MSNGLHTHTHTHTHTHQRKEIEIEIERERDSLRMPELTRVEGAAVHEAPLQ